MSSERSLILVGGIHTVTTGWKERVNHNKSFHWLPQIQGKVLPYALEVLGLDGSVPALDPSGNAIDPLWLIGTPKQICGKDTYLHVSGDLLKQRILQLPHPHTGLEDRSKVQDESKRGDFLEAVSYGLKVGGELTAGIALTAQGWKEALKVDILRRSFLFKGSLALGTGAFYMGRLSPFVGSFIPWFRMDGVWGKFVEATQFRWTDSTWLDARTALMISKTEEAMDRLDLPSDASGVVAMGSPHIPKAPKFLRDKEARTSVIEKFAEDLIDESFSLFRKYNWVKEEQKQQFTDTLLTFLALAETHEIQDPQVDYIEDPDEFINSRVRRVDRFLSTEVLQAVSRLGNPYRFFRN